MRSIPIDIDLKLMKLCFSALRHRSEQLHTYSSCSYSQGRPASDKTQVRACGLTHHRAIGSLLISSHHQYFPRNSFSLYLYYNSTAASLKPAGISLSRVISNNAQVYLQKSKNQKKQMAEEIVYFGFNRRQHFLLLEVPH